jgi:hypothetical protein
LKRSFNNYNCRQLLVDNHTYNQEPTTKWPKATAALQQAREVDLRRDDVYCLYIFFHYHKKQNMLEMSSKEINLFFGAYYYKILF